jgi:hypothetical protein
MNESIPMIAYGFVGLTALVLTYATLADNGGKADESTVSMLPSIGGSEPVQAQAPVQTPVQAPVPSEIATETTVGGSEKKLKGGRKSKLNKKKIINKKRRTRHCKV